MKTSEGLWGFERREVRAVAIVELLRTHPRQGTWTVGQTASAECLPRGTISEIGDTSFGLRMNVMLLDPKRPGRARGSAPGAKPSITMELHVTNRVEGPRGNDVGPGI